MKNIISKYFFLIAGLIITIIIIISYIYGINSLKETKRNAKYTVAYITSDWHQKNNNGAGTDFDYYIKNHKTSKTCSYNLKKGTKYLVMYDSLNPSNYIMLGRHQLPDDVQAPYNGWSFKQVPIKLDSTDLKAYFEKEGVE